MEDARKKSSPPRSPSRASTPPTSSPTSPAANGRARPAAMPSRARPRCSCAGSAGPIPTWSGCRCRNAGPCCAGWDMAAPDTLILAGGPGERRIALLADDEVLSFVIDRGDPAVGDVFLGRVLARPAGGGATFVDIGAALPGYLPRSGDWHEGQALAVQVTAEARLDKGAVLTHRVAPESLPDMAALKPPAKLIVPGRLARLLADLPALRQLLVDDPSLLPEARKLFPIAELQRGAWRDSGAADALDLALGRVVPLAGSARLIIDEAAGATIIDVDAGGLDRDTTNRLAMREIARQVRLRNIGGQIVIDPIPGDGSGYLLGLVDQLKSHLAADP